MIHGPGAIGAMQQSDERNDIRLARNVEGQPCGGSPQESRRALGDPWAQTQFCPTTPLEIAFDSTVSQALHGPEFPGHEEADLATVLTEARRGNRVCPKPRQWHAFYELLMLRSAGTRGPRPPISKEEWARSPFLTKRLCFREQIEWAAAQGCLAGAMAFIQMLPENEWHHY